MLKVGGNIYKERSKDTVQADTNTVCFQRCRQSNEDTVLAEMRTVKELRLMRLEDLEEDLLPGIPNDITLDLIIPTFAWRDLHILSSVSHGFQKAVQSHMVYDARVRAGSTETFVVVVHEKHFRQECSESIFAISLHSIRDKSWKELPSIPNVPSGIPHKCLCVSLKGKIYVLGGAREVHKKYSAGSSKVYVMDLAGDRQWRRCANMQEPRLQFTAGVKDGKIYVFEGISLGTPVPGSEVYDPTTDTWCKIKPMKSLSCNRHVANLGDELLVFGEKIHLLPPNGGLNPSEIIGFVSKGACFVSEIYDPTKDEWRLIKEDIDWASVFTAQGKVHMINRDGIFLYNFDSHSSTLLHSHSYPELENRSELDVYSDVYVSLPLAVDGELLAILGWGTGRKLHKISILQSRGFGRLDKKEILWEDVICLPWVLHRACDPPFITIKL